MVEIVCTCIAGIASVIAAAIGLHVKKENKKMEHRSELRQRESLLSLRMMDATLQLSVVTSNALTGGHNNGNVERARIAANKAAEDYEEFLREVTVHEVGK